MEGSRGTGGTGGHGFCPDPLSSSIPTAQATLFPLPKTLGWEVSVETAGWVWKMRPGKREERKFLMSLADSPLASLSRLSNVGVGFAFRGARLTGGPLRDD
jgi:hypothetical protein